MLKTLTVENFALIENVTVEFGAGLNILTGETGAGKSILIDALGAALGNRLSVNKIRKGFEYLRVAADFSVEGKIITVERKISRAEKNSITLDGKLITLAALKKFCAAFVDVHGQNKSLELLHEEKIYSLIDDEKISAELKNFQGLYREFNTKVRSLSKKLSAREENLQRLDFLRWQEQEISSANLKANEDEELNAEIKKLSHAEKIAEHVNKSAQILNGEDFDILTALARAEKNLDIAIRYDDKLNSARQLLEDAEINLREAYEEIRDYGESLDFSPERLDELQARSDIIFKLKHKYGATVNDILQRLDKIRVEIAEAENFDSDVEELQKNISELEIQTKLCAKELLKLRQASARTLSAAIELEIRRLGMPQAQFEIIVEPSEKLSAHGGDKADIKFSANVGEEKLSLSKVVSGGELSRIALAIKTISAGRADSAETMVFDEIDTGISGEVSAKMADVMRDLSENCQVIAITHQPQIAAKADSHYLVFKESDGLQTQSDIRALTGTERREAIARMVGDGAVTETSLQMADALMQPCANGKKEE